LRVAVSAPVISMYMFLATPDAPFGMVMVVSAPSVMLWVTTPLIACSSRVPRFVLVVVPQVPDCSPVPISSRERFVLYVDAMIFPFANSAVYHLTTNGSND